MLCAGRRVGPRPSSIGIVAAPGVELVFSGAAMGSLACHGRGNLGCVRRNARPAVLSGRALFCCLCRFECVQAYPSQRPEGVNWDVRPSVVAVPTAMCPLTGSSQYHAPPDWIQPVSIIPLPSSQYQLPPSWTQPPERIAPLVDRRNQPLPSLIHPVRIWALPGCM